jgi:hypothetical protein
MPPEILSVRNLSIFFPSTKPKTRTTAKTHKHVLIFPAPNPRFRLKTEMGLQGESKRRGKRQYLLRVCSWYVMLRSKSFNTFWF